MGKLELSSLDRALLSVFPKYGRERIRARAAVELFARHYEAAQPGRRTQNWRRDGTDADVALKGAARDLRNSARDLIRNNGWARRAQTIVANHTVGTGIRPRPIADGNEAVEKKTADLWKRWAGSTECESDGRATFYGIQHQMMRAVVSDGEAFLRRRYRRLTDSLTIPLQLQVLEADYLHTGMNALTSQAGGPIIQGIELDKLGRRAAYWMWSQHPGSGRNLEVPKRIPASEIIHLFSAERLEQRRGVSWLAFGILNVKDLDEYDDAELVKQKIAACFAAFVTDTDGLASPIGEPGAATGNTDEIETLEPGMIMHLAPGKEITTASPPSITSDSMPNRVLHKFAAGVGVTFEDLTGDYSNSNFSSARMARLGHWANVEQWQWNMTIPILCDGVWNWAIEAAQLAGELPDGVEITARWTCPGMPMLEPDKEGLAIQRNVRNGVLTLSDAIRQNGKDPDEHLAEYAADMKKLDALELVLDCDARHTTAAGQEQASETAINSPADPPAPALKKKAPPARSEELAERIAALEAKIGVR